MKALATNPVLLQKYLERLQTYIDEKLPKQSEPPKPEPPKSNDHIRYSLAEPAYDEDYIPDMSRFLSQAKMDSAMFNTPALKKTYHLWEKKAAITKTFSSEVIHRLKESKTRPADFYKAAELDKRVYSSMKRDYCYTPSRTTAIKCCFALHLSYQDAEQLLKLAGYSLSPGLSKDLALRFCLENGIYDIANVNYLLDALGESPLS